MVELQLLNTLLFSDNVSNLKKAINTLNNPTNPKQGGLKAEQVKNILSYAVVYNTNLNKEVINKALTEDANKTAKDEEVIKKTLTKAAKKALTKAAKKALTEAVKEAKEAVKEAKEADKKAKEEDAKEAKEDAKEAKEDAKEAKEADKKAKEADKKAKEADKKAKEADKKAKEADKKAKEADKKAKEEDAKEAKEEDAKEAKEEAVEKTAKNYLISNFTTSKLTEILDEVIKQSFKDQTAFTESVEKAFTESVEKAAKNYLISKFTIFTEAVEKVAKNEESVEKAAKNYPISEFTTSELTKISDEIIKQSFKAQEAKHKFFSPKTVDSQDQQPINSPSFEAAENQYVKAFKFSNLITYIEKGTWDNNIISGDCAYKMLVCFGQTKNNTTDQTIITNFIKFLRTSNFHNFMKEVALPENSEEVTLPKWQKMIQKDGPEALKLFAFADIIEQFKAPKSVDSHLPPTNIEEARSLYIKSQYPEYYKYPAAAELCYQYNILNDTFRDILRVEKKKKTTDNIPDIHVDGKDILQTNGKDCAGYHLVKLPIGDPHTYFLGHIVNDCRSIDGIGSEGVENGITDKNSGFYVLLKSKNGYKADSAVFNEDGEINYSGVEIVGQGYAFRTNTKNLTFNSWENLRHARNAEDKIGDDHIATQMLKAACNKIIIDNHDIAKVTIGITEEVRTPRELRENIPLYNEVPMLPHFNRLNTSEQAVIAQNFQLAEIQDAFKSIFDNIEVMSIEQEEKLKHLLKEKNFAASVNKMFSNNKELLLTILKYSVVEDLSLASLQGFSDPEIINLLISPNALKAYDAGIKIDQLKGLKKEQINVLTSRDALKAYNAGVEIDQLKGLETEKTELLLSNRALLTYELGVKLEQLKGLDIERIKVLTLYEARVAYYKTGIKIEQLEGLETEKIEELFSIINNPQNKSCTGDELKKLLTDKIKDLTRHTSDHTSEEPESVLFNLQDIDSLKPSEVTDEVDITGQLVDAY